MIRDLLQVQPQSNYRTQICLVGAGAAGIVLALELVRLGKTVTLLEGGGATIEEESQDPYRGESSGLAHRGLHTGRFRTLGGTTTMWGGQILELGALDFKERSWVLESGWPFSKQELEPFYQRALQLEAVDGAIQEDAAVWRAIGEPEPAGFDGMRSYLSRWCPEPNFARLHQAFLRHNPKIQIWIHTNAVELLMEGETVQGVRCLTQTGFEVIFRAEEYIFCLGTIESSRFFLQPRENGTPWNQSGLLGKHFQDHIDSDAATVLPKSRKEFHRVFDTIFHAGYKYTPKLAFTEQAQREAAVLNVGATMFSVSEEDGTLLGLKTTAKSLLVGKLNQIKPRDVWEMVRNSPVLFAQTYRYAMQHRAWHPPSAEFRMRVHCEQEPTSRSSITLSDQRDSLGLLRARLNWKISQTELCSIRTFVQQATKSLQTLATIVPHPDLFEDGDAFLAQCQDSFHHMGGMRMNSSASLGVVDTNLKLYGTRNCYVCSGAVFPASGFSNPTHTLLALAVRLATHVAAI